MKSSQIDEQLKRIINISRLYYQDGLSQIEIAKKIGVSRPTIAKALQSARDNGIVKIEIVDPFMDIHTLQKQLQRKYRLKRVIVTFPQDHTETSVLNSLGNATAEYLNDIVNDNDIIGINWGKTMEAIAKHLHESQRQNVKVVQLKGSVTNSHESNFSTDITKHFNRAFHTQASILPLPVIFDDPQIKSVAIKNRFINNVIQEGEDANIAIFTVGTTRANAMLFRLGYLDNATIEGLKKEAVGDIISHFITKDGSIADISLDARTVAIPLDKLKNKAYSILVAGGEKKLAAIHAALIGKYANVLVVDELAAKKLLDLYAVR